MFIGAFENGLAQSHSIYNFKDAAQFCFHLSLFANNSRQVEKVFNVIFNVVAKVLVK